MCFFRKRRERKKVLAAEMAAKKEQEVQKAVVEEPKVKESQPEVVVETKVEIKPEVKDEPKVEKVQEKPLEGTEQKSQAKTPKIPKYHVSQIKDDDSENFKKWRVRKEGSTKTIKFFDTQKEAIVFAEQLAESAGSSVVIHKVDGSIRKQDYTKKE
jgi:hypothetical protein